MRPNGWIRIALIVGVLLVVGSIFIDPIGVEWKKLVYDLGLAVGVATGVATFVGVRIGRFEEAERERRESERRQREADEHASQVKAAESLRSERLRQEEREKVLFLKLEDAGAALSDLQTFMKQAILETKLDAIKGLVQENVDQVYMVRLKTDPVYARAEYDKDELGIKDRLEEMIREMNAAKDANRRE